jgi:hypothetical protein
MVLRLSFDEAIGNARGQDAFSIMFKQPKKKELCRDLILAIIILQASNQAQRLTHGFLCQLSG